MPDSDAGKLVATELQLIIYQEKAPARCLERIGFKQPFRGFSDNIEFSWWRNYRLNQSIRDQADIIDPHFILMIAD
ncbi:MAG: hypothetical protein ACD_39C00903G0001 [uncultured bacterium]|nr:MAG: hypothetical protein ACD_39C00903G0001 [uncultured bacterium]